MKISVGIVGASGYTGQELVKILSRHARVEIKGAASRKHAGKPLSTLMGPDAPEMDFCEIDSAQINDSRVIFAALPHCTAINRVADWRNEAKTVIDLSADFRLKDAAVYEKWYNVQHSAQALLGEAVYGLPEIYRDEIKKADLIACPGCYPTAAILGLLPAVKAGFIKEHAVVNAVSGTTGAGRQSNVEYSFSELSENFYAYGAPDHRHTPEMEQELTVLSGGGMKVTFVPHLGPFERGIYATIYADATKPISQEEISGLYSEHYGKEPFVSVCENNPHIKDVRGTNSCHVRPIVDERAQKLVIISALDNLVKGAAGQAVQCFNLRFGFDESEGLR